MLNYNSNSARDGQLFSPDQRCISMFMDCHRGDQSTCLTPLNIHIPKRVRNFGAKLNFHMVYHVDFGTYRAFEFDSNDVKLTFA